MSLRLFLSGKNLFPCSRDNFRRSLEVFPFHAWEIITNCKILPHCITCLGIGGVKSTTTLTQSKVQSGSRVKTRIIAESKTDHIPSHYLKQEIFNWLAKPNFQAFLCLAEGKGTPNVSSTEAANEGLQMPLVNLGMHWDQRSIMRYSE